MDKENQDNKEVGEDFNYLSHEKTSPPLWDDISQELDTFEGVDVPVDSGSSDMEHLADVADFSVLKEGFELNFKTNQPPKFLWDDIEQELESFTITDNVAAFSAIKASFEETYKEKSVPNFTWNDLSSEMDNPTPKVVEEDYSFVKSGFEKQYSGVVLPLFNWNDLAERMDSEAVLADTADKYSVIKDSFAQQYNAATPAASTWNKINAKLNLQTIRGRILHKLKKKAYPYWAKKAMLVCGAIGLLIGGGKSCLFENPSIPTSASGTIVYAQPVGEDEVISIPYFNKNNSLIPTKGGLEKDKFLPGIFNSKTDKTNAALHGNASANNKNSKNSKNNNSDGNATVIDATPIAMTNNSNGLNNSYGTQYGLNTTTTAVNKKVQVANATSESQYDEDGNEVIATNNININANRNSNFTNSRLNVANKNGELIANTSLDNKPDSYHQLQYLIEHNFALNNNAEEFLRLLSKTFVDDPAIVAMKDNNFTIVRQRLKNKKLRFEVGLIAKVGTSLFLSKSNSEAYSATGFSSTKMRLTGSLGVMGNCFLTANDAIVVGLSPYSTAQQYFGEFTPDGYYTTREIKLSYLDFSLGYQRTLFRYNNLGKVPSKIYARLDLGLGYLTKGETIINNEIRIETGDLYNKLNLSLGLSFGNTHEIKQLLIDYGVSANIGMGSVVANSAQLSTIEPVNLLNIGGYVGVRYILFAKIRMKTRQFEWSPPFYIEEPMP